MWKVLRGGGPARLPWRTLAEGPEPLARARFCREAGRARRSVLVLLDADGLPVRYLRPRLEVRP